MRYIILLLMLAVMSCDKQNCTQLVQLDGQVLDIHVGNKRLSEERGFQFPYDFTQWLSFQNHIQDWLGEGEVEIGARGRMRIRSNRSFKKVIQVNRWGDTYSEEFTVNCD
jgi:hypothetical protein